MSQTLSVHLNRDGSRSVDPEAFSFETDGAFDLRLINHGTPAHVHVHLDDSLARVASIPNENVYVEGDAEKRLRVNVARQPRPVKGILEVVTGYGAERANVNVQVTDLRPENGDVPVDERLSARPDGAAQSTPVQDAVRPAAVAAIGVLAAVLLTVFVNDTVALALGAVALVAAVGVAIYVLVSDDY